MIHDEEAYCFFQLFLHSVIVIIRLMLSVWVWPKVITLSGFYCIISLHKKNWLISIFFFSKICYLSVSLFEKSCFGILNKDLIYNSAKHCCKMQILKYFFFILRSTIQMALRPKVITLSGGLCFIVCRIKRTECTWYLNYIYRNH